MLLITNQILKNTRFENNNDQTILLNPFTALDNRHILHS